MVTRRQTVTDPKPMLEGIGPETDLESSASEHGTNSIGDGQVCTFNRSILMQRVSTSGTKGVSKLGEEGTDCRIGVELTTLVKMDVFVRTRGSMLAEELLEPVNGSGLRDASDANLESKEMIGDKEPAGFTVEADVFRAKCGIRRANTRKEKSTKRP